MNEENYEEKHKLLFETWEMLIKKGKKITISGEFKNPENINHELFYKTVESLLKQGIHINFSKEFENVQLQEANKDEFENLKNQEIFLDENNTNDLDSEEESRNSM